MTTRNFQFMQGPWKVIQYNGFADYSIAVADRNGIVIAEIVDFDNDHQTAALIAAAPEMYAMLQRICEMQAECYGHGIETHLNLITMAKDARDILKKARGESSSAPSIPGIPSEKGSEA